MGDDEVVYQDWEARQSSIKTRSSYYKIEGAIEKAKKDSLEWLWVDTVCIDKASSAELTEAINSMYEWYKNATICYAYMADVPPLNEADHDPFRKFQNSRWFRRGWTLQEQIAPSTLLFFSAQWTRIGTRSGRIAEIVSSVTGIELDILTGESTLASASVAKKMSWLSKRTTTRIEDIAYCMLGIFDVNMPLLYGEEGMKAFVRLQGEIIKVSNNHTIFCWEWDDSVPGGWVNMLAPSPTAFSNSGGYEPREDVGTLVPYSITNLGLSINLPVIYTMEFLFAEIDAVLRTAGHKTELRTYIPLFQVNSPPGSKCSGSKQALLGRWPFPWAPMRTQRHRHARRHDLFVQCRSTSEVRMSINRQIPVKYAFMLFLNPAGLQSLNYLNGDRKDGLMESRNWHISTYPEGMFDHDSGMLWFSAPEDEDLPQSCLLRFELSLFSPYFAFFKVHNDGRGQTEWRCAIYPGHIFNHRRFMERDDNGDQSVSAKKIHRRVEKYLGTRTYRHRSREQSPDALGDADEEIWRWEEPRHVIRCFSLAGDLSIKYETNYGYIRAHVSEGRIFQALAIGQRLLRARSLMWGAIQRETA
ncbi:het domain-containing protein [Seiridium cupressi]